MDDASTVEMEETRPTQQQHMPLTYGKRRAYRCSQCHQLRRGHTCTARPKNVHHFMLDKIGGLHALANVASTHNTTNTKRPRASS